MPTGDVNVEIDLRWREGGFEMTRVPVEVAA
jgi:hypothetical protein